MTERRRDPVTGEWRTVATARREPTTLQPDERCALCPTVDSLSPTDVPWPSFEVAVVDDQLPSLTGEPPPPGVGGVGVYRVEPALGAAEVIVYSDDHAARLGSLGVERVRLLVDVWAERYGELGRLEGIDYVFVFEDRAHGTGAERHHPHGHVHGYPEIPPLPARELEAARQHLARRGTCVLCDVVAQERSEGLRLVASNEAFLAFVPFAARFPFEVHVVAHRHAPSLLDLSDPDRDALAEILDQVASRYDAVADVPLPYVMSMHQAPTDDGGWEPVSHLHVEFTPLHRSTGTLTYHAGAELGAGEYLNDVAPEQAAAELRGARAG